MKLTINWFSYMYYNRYDLVVYVSTTPVATSWTTLRNDLDVAISADMSARNLPLAVRPLSEISFTVTANAED